MRPVRLYCGGGRDGRDADAGPGNGAATLNPVCGTKERRLANKAQVGAPLAGAGVAIVVVLLDAGRFVGHVYHVHDGRNDEIQIANIVEVAVALVGTRNGDVFVERDGTNLRALHEDEVDAGLLAVFVGEEANVLAVFQEAEVCVKVIERQNGLADVEANRRGVAEQLVDQRRRKNVGLPHALPGFKSAEGAELVDQVFGLLGLHAVDAAQDLGAVVGEAVDAGIPGNLVADSDVLLWVPDVVAQGFALLCNLDGQGVLRRIVDDAVVVSLLDKLFIIGQAGLTFLGLIVL